MSASKCCLKVDGKGFKIDYAAKLRDLPSTPNSEADGHVQAPDDDDFESPATTKKQSNDPFTDKQHF